MTPHKTIADYEQALFSHLDQEAVHPSDTTMRRIVVRNFYDQRREGNEDICNEKIAYLVFHFIEFQKYVTDEWAKK